MSSDIRDKKILIVDDEEIIVDVLSRRFERMGFSVVSACDGKKAVDVLQTQDIDLVICDVLMPNSISGEAVLKAAREHHPKLHFVAISGNIMSDDSVQELMNLGADLFIKKPFPSLAETAEKIVSLID